MKVKVEAVTVVWVKTTTEPNDIRRVPVLLKRKGRYCIDGSVCMGGLERENDPKCHEAIYEIGMMAYLKLEPGFVSTMFHFHLSNWHGPFNVWLLRSMGLTVALCCRGCSSSISHKRQIW